jgi:hypothetical protein
MMIIDDTKIIKNFIKFNKEAKRMSIGDAGYMLFNGIGVFIPYPSTSELYSDVETGYHFTIIEDPDELGGLCDIPCLINGSVIETYNNKKGISLKEIEIGDLDIIFRFTDGGEVNSKILDDDAYECKRYTETINIINSYKFDPDEMDEIILSDDEFDVIKTAQFPIKMKVGKYKIRVMNSIFRSPTKGHNATIKCIGSNKDKRLCLNIIKIQRTKNIISVHSYINIVRG